MEDLAEGKGDFETVGYRRNWVSTEARAVVASGGADAKFDGHANQVCGPGHAQLGLDGGAVIRNSLVAKA